MRYGVHCDNCLKYSRGAKGVTVIAFQRIHGDVGQSCGGNGHGLHLVVVHGGSAMGIESR